MYHRRNNKSSIGGSARESDFRGRFLIPAPRTIRKWVFYTLPSRYSAGSPSQNEKIWRQAIAYYRATHRVWGNGRRKNVRRKTLYKAKLVVHVRSDKATRRIETVSIFDNRTQENWTPERIKERNCEWFLNLDDLKETLNWNLNGDSSKYQFTWGQSTKRFSDGYAFIFDKEGKKDGKSVPRGGQKRYGFSVGNTRRPYSSPTTGIAENHWTRMFLSDRIDA